MHIRINPVRDPAAYEQIAPNFIYNRFDLFRSENNFFCICVKNGRKRKTLQYRITGSTAELGLWLVPVTREELERIILYIHDAHPNVKTITYKNGVIPYGTAKAHNHFRIVFPETVEEMEHSISSKSRAKMKKKLLHAQEAYGQMQLLEYDRVSLPDEIVNAFFEFKKIIRNRSYNMTAEEYLDRYHVSHCYVVKFGDTIGAIRFSCEQCPVVYGENFTYNPELSDYSLGRFIFMHHLIRMVEKKHTQLFFAGGDYDYKKHYGSIEETLYDCKIDVKAELPALKNKHSRSRQFQRYIKKHFPKGLVSLLRKAKRYLKQKLH